MQSLSKKNKSLQPDMLQDTGCDPDLHLHVECNGVQRAEKRQSAEEITPNIHSKFMPGSYSLSLN